MYGSLSYIPGGGASSSFLSPSFYSFILSTSYSLPPVSLTLSFYLRTLPLKLEYSVLRMVVYIFHFDSFSSAMAKSRLGRVFFSFFSSSTVYLSILTQFFSSFLFPTCVVMGRGGGGG